MPSVSKIQTASGVRYRGEASVEHKRGGKREYRTFRTKAEALSWAMEREKSGLGGMVAGRSVVDLLDKYAKEVSPKKAGARWELVRLTALSKMPLGSVMLDRLGPADLAKWRDSRLKEVSPATVNRELNLMSHCFSTAVKEWRWLAVSPTTGVSRPAPTPARTRTYSPAEIERIMVAAGTDVGTISGRVGMAFLFALESGMRAGEICALTWDRVFAKHVHVDKGKTASARRDVPLSKAALTILKAMRGQDKALVFALSSAQLDATFRKIAKRAMVDAHFHDARRAAATRIARLPGIDVLSLCRAFGWNDVRMAMVYFAPSADDMAAKLD